MADATVSMVLNRLAPLIEKRVRQEVNLLINAEKEAQDLSSKLKKIRKVLADAERRVVTDPRVQSWLQKLQDIAYEIDYVLDKWEAKYVKQRFEESEDAYEAASSSDLANSWDKKVCSFLESVCSCFRQTVQHRSIAFDIKGINQRLDSIDEENEKEFKFIPNLGRDESSEGFMRHSSTSFVDLSEVHGRDLDKENLMIMLLSSSEGSSQDGIKTVSIVGGGGMGKTTLAQLVFNDVVVKEKFDVKIWVCVSAPFDEIKIAKAILEAVIKGCPNLIQYEMLLQCIGESVLGMKFLLVLDDVWIEDEELWRPLKVSLGSGAPGSRVLVTTRKEKVARIMDSVSVHSLEPLEDVYCWSVLSQIAFHERTDREKEMLKETGREIAKKCKGLPLAAKTLGGVLRFKASQEDWKRILRSETGELEGVRKGIFPFLKLSYDELQPEVRRCFSYCAIFPKGTTIGVNNLIRIWMAQGFLTSENAMDMEVVGRGYFDDLAMRSFFQDFVKDDDGGIIDCKMHDILHDFAQFLTNNECLVIDQVRQGADQMACDKDVRHICLMIPESDSIHEYEKLRSFICRPVVPPYLFSRLKRIRLLSPFCCDLLSIPDEIGDLVHMRYLDLSGNSRLTELPEAICDLYNLQTLGIEHCTSLLGLPQGIHKLINLRHLLNRYTSPNFKLPQGFKKLTNLRTLGIVYATSESGHKLGCLKDLNQLGGKLCIVVDGDGMDEDEAKKADLKSKKSLRKLVLHCGFGTRKIVDVLQPHPNLTDLVCNGLFLPTWITTLVHLRSLVIGNLYVTGSIGDVLSPLGQLPFLECLCIYFVGMKHVGREFISTTLPKLKTLIFLDCPLWQEWEDIEEDKDGYVGWTSNLQSMKHLSIRRCGQLRALPHRLLRAKAVEFLEIENCEHLRNRYTPETGSWWDELDEIPFKVIRGGPEIPLTNINHR